MVAVHATASSPASGSFKPQMKCCAVHVGLWVFPLETADLSENKLTGQKFMVFTLIRLIEKSYQLFLYRECLYNSFQFPAGPG